MKYGLSIFGTTEAFQGIDHDFEEMGGLCNNSGDFISQITAFSLTENYYNPYTDKMFKCYYSSDVVISRFCDFISEVI